MLEAPVVSAPCLPSGSPLGLEDVVDWSTLSLLFSRSGASEDCGGGSSCDANFSQVNRRKSELVEVEVEVAE